jgi:hypothetical protein
MIPTLFVVVWLVSPQDLKRFPERDFTLRATVRLHEELKKAQRGRPGTPAARIIEINQRLQPWLFLHVAYFARDSQLQDLRNLRDQIGITAYLQGRMPFPVMPYWLQIY